MIFRCEKFYSDFPYDIFNTISVFHIRHNLLLIRFNKLFCYKGKAVVCFPIPNIHENHGIMDLLLTIEKLVHGGLGLARTDRGVVFVSDVAPGEKVRAIPDGAIGGQPIAKPVEIVEPAACRRTPGCEHFGTCGGCDWLHISYDAQLSIKRGIFIECLERIGKIKLMTRARFFPRLNSNTGNGANLKSGAARNGGVLQKKKPDGRGHSRCPLVSPLNVVLEALPRLSASYRPTPCKSRRSPVPTGQSPARRSFEPFPLIQRCCARAIIPLWFPATVFSRGTAIYRKKSGPGRLTHWKETAALISTAGWAFFQCCLVNGLRAGCWLTTLTPR